MLGFAPLGQFPLGQPAVAPAVVTVGSGISGGTFSKGRWHRLKEDERARALAVVRARQNEELRRRTAAFAQAAAVEAARDAARAAEDRANAERARRQAVIDALAALSGARSIGEAFVVGAPTATLAAEAQRAKAAEQDEEEAIVRLLLLDA
jgi:hypothetical protein